MLGLGIILPILPLYATDIGVSGFWLGAIFAGFSIARSAFMPVVGRLSDKTGNRKRFIAIGLFFYALSSLGYIYSFDTLSLFLVRIIQGLCSAMIVPIAMAYIGDISPKDREATYMGQFTVSLLLGFGFGPILGGCIQEVFNVNAAFIAMGLLCFLAFLFVMMWLPAVPHKNTLKRERPASYSTIMQNSQMRGVICYRYTIAFARAAVLTFLPLYASLQLKLSGAQIGLIISCSILLSSFLQYPCGRLADRLDRRNLIIIGSLLYCLTIVLLPYCVDFWQVLGTNLLLGILGALSLPAASALIVDEGKKYGMGSSMALFNVAMSLGLGSGPLVSGIILDIAGLKAVFYFATGIGIAGTMLAGHFMHSSPPPAAPGRHRIVEEA